MRLDPRRDRLPRSDRELERLTWPLHDGRCIRPRRDRDRHLRLVGELDVAKRANFLHHIPAGDGGRCLHHHGLVRLLVRRHGIGRRREHDDRLLLPSLDLHRSVEGVACRKILDVDADRALESLRPRGRKCEFASAARTHLRILPTHRNGERWQGRSHRERVVKVVRFRCDPGPADVRKPQKIVAIGRRHEEQLRIHTETLRRFVVVLVQHPKHRQAIRCSRGTGRQRLHDPRRLTEGMRDGGGTEKCLPLAVAGIDGKAGVGPPRILPEPDHLAVGIKVFVELHLPPVLEPVVARLDRVLAAEREPRIPGGLQNNLFDWIAGGVEHLDPRVEQRLRPGGIHLEEERLAAPGSKPKAVGIARTTDRALDLGREGDGHRLLKQIVGLLLGRRRRGGRRCGIRLWFFGIDAGGRRRRD